MPDQTFVICRPPEAPPLTVDEIRAVLNTERPRYEWGVLEVTKTQSTLQELVDMQAEDEGLWFIAETVSEAYLQHELRRLHALIEQEAGRKWNS